MKVDACSIGKSPWKNEEFIELLKEFANLYESRPIKNNDGGQLSAQLFYSWFVAKKLQPNFIIESGVWKGQGTWAFEKACPNAKIICLDPYPKYFDGYVSKSATYVHHDFFEINWSTIENKENALCFFDDHQDAVQRIRACEKLGFKKIMFEDNYPPGQGDCRSLKKLFESSENLNEREEITSYIKVYHELPPIFDIEFNRWGLKWDVYRSNPALLKEINHAWEMMYRNDMQQYTWINYVELK